MEETLIGIFALDEANNIVAHHLYPHDPDKIADAINKTKTGAISRKIIAFFEELAENNLITSSQSLAEGLTEKEIQTIRNGLKKMSDNLVSMSEEIKNK